MSRSSLRFVARWMALFVLLAQVSVAAYACPALTPSLAASMDMAPSTNAATPDLASMPSDCVDMAGPQDPPASSLCAEHCKSGQQSDRMATVSLTPAALGGWYVRPASPEIAPSRRPAPSRVHAMAHALALTAPPHAIAHCVRRT